MSKPKTDARRPCIYVAQSATTRKCYVGQTRYGLTHRQSQHRDRAFNKQHNTKFAVALRELGWGDFQWEVVYVVREELDKETLQDLLNEKEKFYVKYYNSFADGYNSDPGGAGGIRYKYSTLEEKREAKRLGLQYRRSIKRDYVNETMRNRRSKNRSKWNTRQRKKRYENIEAYRAAFNERRRRRKESHTHTEQ